MRQTKAGAAALMAALAVPAAQAQTADLTKATCAQLMDLPRNDRGQLIVWLHGYYAGAAQRPVIDRAGLEEVVTAIQQVCERNRDLALIGSEARTIFLSDPPSQLQPSRAPPGQDTVAGPSPPALAPSR